MALQATNIADLVTTTQRELGKLKWTDLSSDIQEYYALPNLMKKEKVQFDSGYEIQWNIMNGTSGAAKNVGLQAVDNANIGDVMLTASIPWRHSTSNYSYDEREVAMNREPARIVELIKARRTDAMVDLAKLMESNFWGASPDAADTLKPYSIDYWVTYAASEGFNGTVSSDHTTVAGINPTTYSRHCNYTSNYSAGTKADLVAKMRAAATKCVFKSPVEMPTYEDGVRYGYYTNYSVLSSLETLLENQNDSLGSDLASQDGLTKFRRNPVIYVPQLDGNAARTNPVYGLNWSTLKFVFLKGEYLNETSPLQAPNQHKMYTVHIDLTYNTKCVNRRANFVLATA